MSQEPGPEAYHRKLSSLELFILVKMEALVMPGGGGKGSALGAHGGNSLPHKMRDSGQSRKQI